MLCIFDKAAFFPLCCESTSSKRFKIYGEMATLGYNDHRSSFSMLLTIGHQVVPCTMGKHNALWFSNLKKPSTLINLEHSKLVTVYSNKILLTIYSNGLVMGWYNVYVTKYNILFYFLDQ
jgi:hypothetical protein